jgi:hypothetical protein
MRTEIAPLQAVRVDAVVSGISLEYCYGDDGPAYWARGDIADDVFRAALRREVDDDDPIMRSNIKHGYMRYSPDPEGEHPVVIDFDVAHKRGAWLATWVFTDR